MGPVALVIDQHGYCHLATRFHRGGQVTYPDRAVKILVKRRRR